MEAMRATDSSGQHVDDLSRATEVGTRYDVTWTSIADRDAATTSTRKQPPSDAVTRARQLEGAWWDEGGCYFVSSFARSESPGVPHDGQVWYFDPAQRAQHRDRTGAGVQRVHRPGVLSRRQVSLRQRADPRDHVRDHRALEARVSGQMTRTPKTPGRPRRVLVAMTSMVVVATVVTAAAVPRRRQPATAESRSTCRYTEAALTSTTTTTAS